jgi:hypothetical protein
LNKIEIFVNENNRDKDNDLEHPALGLIFNCGQINFVEGGDFC